MSAAAGKNGKPGLEWQGCACQIRTLLAPACQRAAKYLGYRDAEERRGDIRPAIDVLLEGTSFAGRTPAVADQAHGIYVEQKGSSAPLGVGLRIEDLGRAERQLEGLRAIRALVEKEAQIRRRLVRFADGQQHGPGSILPKGFEDVRLEPYSRQAGS